jgi:molybdenum cofactor synthesis domain-containing protein
MNPIRAAIVILSDKGFAGQREDLSGPALRELLEGHAEITTQLLLPDDRDQIAAALVKLCDENVADVVLTSGGTGFTPRDVTPEATLDVVERLAPGIPEAMRAHSMRITNRAMLSRAAAGIRGRTLIINLPGSPKAVRECMEIVLPVLPHAVETLRGESGDCAR